MSIFTTAAASFALAAASLAAGTASAAPFGDAPSAEVRYGDLDLTSTHDVARLNRRIVSAAKAVCGNYDPRNLPQATNAKACVNEAIAAAMPTVELAVAHAGEGAKLAGALPANTNSVP